MDNGKFIISLDFELHWGGVEKWNLNKKRDYFLNTRKIIPEFLAVFDENNIRSTWASVGFLFAINKNQLLKFSPKLIPSYIDEELNYYDLFPKIGDNEKDDPFHYGHSLIQKILDTPGQELASHTFTHYYCNEPGQTLEQFDADLKAAQAIAIENFGVSLKSLVFPRNQFNRSYLKVAKINGIKVVRSNPDVWFWNKNYGKLTPLFRAIDTLIPISKSLCFRECVKDEQIIQLPASRFYRPYFKKEKIFQKIKLNRIKREMTYAAKNKLNYHLWWHPHNFGNEVENNMIQLREIIEHFKKLENDYNFYSVNMSDFIKE